MIKFFRKIRQNSIAENKFSDYLKYAIGEILLVVIGILIALSINNWNDYQKDRAMGKVLLESLLKDLEKDQSILVRASANNRYNLKIMDTLFYKISANSNYNMIDFHKTQCWFSIFQPIFNFKGNLCRKFIFR